MLHIDLDLSLRSQQVLNCFYDFVTMFKGGVGDLSGF